MVGRCPLSMITPQALAGELARFYRRARRQIPADWGAASAEELHELRKCVVIHRYQIELAEPLWPRFGRMWTDEAERLVRFVAPEASRHGVRWMQSGR